MDVIELTQDMIVAESGEQAAIDFFIESQVWDCYDDESLADKGLI